MSSSSDDSDYGPPPPRGEGSGKAPVPSDDDEDDDASDKSEEEGDDERDLSKRPAPEEDEEDSEEEEEARPRKKKRRKGGLRGSDFILRDVDVGEEEDEEYAAGGAEEDLGLDRNERAEAERAQKEAAAMKQARRRPEFFQENMSEDQLEDYFQKKYGQREAAATRDDDDEGYEVFDDISQQGLLPSTKDPNLWIVRCRMGEEKNTTLLLMRKFLSMEESEEPLEIKSVVVKEHLKGYIYIEAFKQTHVMQAINGISALSQYNVSMVPIKDMVDTLKVVKNVPTLKKKAFVRLKRSVYKDDLAQVEWVDVPANLVHLRLVPRIDMSRKRGALRDQDDAKRQHKRRPPPKLFDEDAVRAIGGEIHPEGDSLIFENQRFQKGFLCKPFPLNAVIVEGVKPTLSELERFQETSEDLKSELAATVVADSAPELVPGDRVEVCEGELINLRGKVTSVDGERVTILPEHQDLHEPLVFTAGEVRKCFVAGDHVRVTAGRYEGDTGLIVRVEEETVILFSDLTMHELKIRPRDAILCQEVATGVDAMGQFSYGDLVQMDQQTVGVIVRLEKEHLQVLNQHGNLVRVKHQAVTGKKDNRHAVALDSDSNSISVGDMVKVVDGTHTGRSGEVKHVYRSFIFIFSRLYPDNGGVFVSRARHLLLAGAKASSSERQSFGGLTPFMNSPYHSPAHPSSGGGSSVGGRTPGRPGGATPGGQRASEKVRRDAAIIGKSVKIIQGPLKGYTGIVKDATENTARVELHAMCQTISVDRSRLNLMNADGATAGSLSTYQPGRTPGAHSSGGRTPGFDGGKTPMYGSQTPMYGSQTPMHDGSRTPHYSGAMTPAYGTGASAWDPTVANTPAHGGDGAHTPDIYDESSPSPALPPTPGYAPYTPGMYGQINSPYSPYDSNPYTP